MPEDPGNANRADLLVFVDGTQPYFKRNVAAGAGVPGTFNAVPQKVAVG